MKTKLTALLIMLSVCCYAQTKNITGFMGFPFSSSSKTVIDSLSKRGRLINDGLSKVGIYNFKDIDVGGRKTYAISVGFSDDKLYNGSIFFTVDGPQNSIDDFNAINRTVADLYGPPQQKVRDFKYPYKETDTDSWMAVRGGYATVMNFWKIQDNSIELSISSKGDFVILSYKDGAIADKVNKKSKEKEEF